MLALPRQCPAMSLHKQARQAVGRRRPDAAMDGWPGASFVLSLPANPNPLHG